MEDGWIALGEKEPSELRQLQEAHGILGAAAESESGFGSKLPLVAARTEQRWAGRICGAGALVRR